MRSFLDIALLPLLLISGLSSPGRGQLHYEVKEEVAIGSLIADIVLDAKLTEKYDSQTLGALRYQFLTRPTANLTVDNRTGMITTNGRLDRDALCPSADICSVPLDIAIQPVKYFQIIKATVDITDINDNDPVFPDPVMTFEVLESAQPGTIAFAVSEAEDVDNQSNSVQSYELLTKGSDAWRLKVDEHPDGARDVRIVLTETLDREAIPEFHLEIIAYDGGSSPRSGTASIVILVEDANDNVPVFEQTSYEVSIDENIPLMTTVIQLTAFDADSGTNSDITYSMSSRSEKQFGHLFGVNDSTGQVYVKGPVDYEVGSAYNLNIIARDNGPGSIPTSANLLINIRDLNDHYPHLTINTLSARDTNRSSVPEDAQVGTFVAHVIVKDPDASLNGQFNCSLEDNAFQLKQTYPEEFHVVTEIKLDRESRAEYSLVIKCTDRGTNPKTTQKSLTIAVDDVNDNPPVFSANMYNADLFENNYLGAFIVKMNATDADLGRNAQITYKLDHKDLAKFEIDSVTGIVKARETLDREEKGEYLLTVTAVDNGHPDQLSSSTSLRVWILDVNDEKPQFTSSVYSLGVLENQEPGTQVGFLDAIDGDKSPYNKHYYYLLPRGSLSDAFEVNRDTGEVTTTRRLDREEHKIYELIAVARDTNGPVLSSTATLSIHVMDLNDNPPQFTFPSADNNTVFMSHKVPLGFIVAQIHADDADLGSNGRVKYQLIQGNNDAVFSIDPTLGVLSINVDLSDQPDNRTWHLHVRATDHGDEPLSTTRVIRVVVKHSLTAGAGHGDKRTMLSGTNFIIVIAVGCISGALIVVLLLVIIILLRKQQVKRNRMQRYNCRVQALQKLAAQEALSGDSTPGGGSVRRGGADGLTDHSGCTGTFPGKINLSHEKSRQWLATLEANAYESHSDYGSSDTSKSLPVGSVVVSMMPDSKGRETKPGMQSFKYGTNGRQWNQDTLQLLGGTTKDDASSLQSGDGSNTDSGRGLSEAELESNKMHAHLSEGSVDTPATSGALHTVQASPHYQPPRSAPHCTTFSSFRGEESPLGKSTMTSPSTPNNNYKNGVIPTKQIDKRSHPYYKHDYNPKSLPKIPEKSPNSSSSESQRNNKSRGVNKRSTGCHGDRSPTNSDVSTLNRHNLTDDDAATTTSGSYVMDPQDLADDLEQQAFCQGVVV